MPSLENLRIDSSGTKSFVYPAADTPPQAAVPSATVSRTTDLAITTSDIIEALGFAPAPLDSPVLTGHPTAPTPSTSDNSPAVATTAFVLAVVGAITGSTINLGSAPAIRTVFGRVGDVVLQAADVTTALGFAIAPLTSPVFIGTPTAPTVVATDNSGKIATTAFAQNLFSSSGGTLRSASVGAGLTLSGNVLTANVTAVFGRTGTVGLTAGDITGALGYSPAPLISPMFQGIVTAPTPVTSDNSTTLATTAFVQSIMGGAAHNLNIQQIGAGLTLTSGVLTGALTSVFGRTGTVVLTLADVTKALNFTPAPALSPALLGTPSAPTPLPGDNSNTLATTAFVAAALSTINLIQFVGSGLSLTSGTLTARISTVFGRTGTIVLTIADISTALGFTPAPTVSPNFTGLPTAPTAIATDNTTTLATTSFVQAAIQGGSQMLSVQASTGLINTLLSTRFSRTLSLIDDFGAEGDGFTDDTIAVNNWVTAVLTNGAIGIAPSGTYSITSALIIDWATAATGALFIGSGVSRCVFSSNIGSSPAFLLTNSTGPTVNNGKILDIGFAANLPGVVLQIGSSAVTFSNFDFDIAISNSDPTSSSCCVESQGLSDSSMAIIATCGGHGNVLRVLQAANCTFSGNLGNADTAIYLTNGAISGNVFRTMDLNTVNTCVMIDSTLAQNNIFIGGQFDWDSGSGPAVSAINATAGSSNRFTGINYPSVGSLATGSLGISIDGTAYGTITTGTINVAAPAGSPTSVTVMAVNGGDAAMLITSDTGPAALTIDNGLYANGSLVFSKMALSRWQMSAVSTSELGPNAGTDLVLTRYSNSGQLLDAPMVIGQSTGITTLTNLSVLGTATFNTIISTTLANSPSYASDAAAELAGIPLGGFYRNGNVVQIRSASSIWSDTINDTGAAADLVGLLIQAAQITENGAAADLVGVLPLFANSSDTMAGADHCNGSNSLQAAIGETGAAATAVSHL